MSRDTRLGVADVSGLHRPLAISMAASHQRGSTETIKPDANAHPFVFHMRVWNTHPPKLCEPGWLGRAMQSCLPGPTKRAFSDQAGPGQVRLGQARRGQARPGQDRALQTRPRHARPGRATPRQVRPGQVRAGQARSGQSRPCQARPGKARQGQAMARQARLGHTMPGQARPSQQGQLDQTSATREAWQSWLAHVDSLPGHAGWSGVVELPRPCLRCDLWWRPCRTHEHSQNSLTTQRRRLRSRPARPGQPRSRQAMAGYAEAGKARPSQARPG